MDSDKSESEQIDIDAKIIKQLNGVNWHEVSEADAASFGLSVGFFRDAQHAWKLHRAACGCAAGGVISSAVLALVCLYAGMTPSFTLALVLIHQVVRTIVLWFRARQAQKVVAETQQQAVDTATNLKRTYTPKHVAAA